MYFNRDFNGNNSDYIQEIIDNGQILDCLPGNWDHIEHNGKVYYIAKVAGCGSGTYGSMDYYRKQKREELRNAVERYNNKIKKA